jgi:hypothetical protein
MSEQKPPEDFASILKKHFQTMQNTAEPGGKPRYRMSERNRRKLERLRQRVEQLRRGQI